MLNAIGDPFSLLVLLLSFLFAITLHGWLQSLLADRFGNPQPRAEGRRAPDPRRHLDPFGAVAGIIVGIGWSKPLDGPARRDRGALLTVFLVPALINMALGLGVLFLVGLRVGPLNGVTARILADGLGGPYGDRALLLFGLMNLYVGALSLVPLPPLDGGRLLFGLAPRSIGWQKAEHQLVERNLGLVAVLALMLIPLGGSTPLIQKVLDQLLSPLVALVTGG